MRTLHWYNELRFDDLELEPVEPLPDFMIDHVEAVFGVVLPQQYRSMLKHHHGDQPLESDRPGTFGGLGQLLTADPRVSRNLFECWRLLGVDRVVPIAEDGGGNFTCLDYRTSGDSEPPVALWFREVGGDDGLSAVAPTFDEFVDQLVIPDDVLQDLAEQAALPADLR